MTLECVCLFLEWSRNTRSLEIVARVFDVHCPMHPRFFVSPALSQSAFLRIREFIREKKKHVNVDKNMKHAIGPQHFGVWLQLWFETIDQLFEGKLADKAAAALLGARRRQKVLKVLRKGELVRRVAVGVALGLFVVNHFVLAVKARPAGAALGGEAGVGLEEAARGARAWGWLRG